MESRISNEYGFHAAQFVDGRNGWVSNEKSMYSTTDGGKTWRHLPLRLALDSRVSSFFFVDNAKGWMTVVNHADAERYALGNSSRILASSDGGRSWTEQANFPDEVDIGCIKFLNRSEGLAVGARVIDGKPAYNELFVVMTNDGGKKWHNISEKVKRAIRNDSGVASDYAHNLEWSFPSRVLLLTRAGRIISSSDQGLTWKCLVQFKDQRPNGSISSTGYFRLLLDPHGSICVTAGSEGEEGYWGPCYVI